MQARCTTPRIASKGLRAASEPANKVPRTLFVHVPLMLALPRRDNIGANIGARHLMSRLKHIASTAVLTPKMVPRTQIQRAQTLAKGIELRSEAQIRCHAPFSHPFRSCAGKC